jgi:hypothetical protein
VTARGQGAKLAGLPSWSGTARWHVAVDETGVRPATKRRGPLRAACNVTTVLVDARDVAQVPASEQCQRQGCKQLWPEGETRS